VPKILTRPDVWFTFVLFLVMIPAEHFEWFSAVENQLQGIRHVLRASTFPQETAAQSQLDSPVVIVDLDESFFEEYKSWPLKRKDIALIVENLKLLGAKVIALDMLMDFPNGYEEDPILAESLSDAGNTMVVNQIKFRGGIAEGINTATPTLQKSTQGGYTNHTLIGDMLSRVRVFPEVINKYGNWPFAVKALSMYKGVEPKLEGKNIVIGDITVPLDHFNDIWIDFPTLPAGTTFLSKYSGIPAMDIFDFDPEDDDLIEEFLPQIEGKIILLGDTSEVSHDIFPTPVGEVYGIEILSNTITTMINQSPIRPANTQTEAGILILMLILIIGVSQAPKFDTLLFFVVVAAYIGLSFYAYIYHGLAVSMTYVLSASLLGFVSTNLYKYMLERKQKTFIKGAFSQYLSPDVIETIVDDPSKLELGGERRDMTAYFSDVQGFSTISEGLTPDELVKLLNFYLTEMCNIIADHNGTVDKFEGDAIIAFWGAPLEQLDHAKLACYASIDMQKKLVEMREQLKEEGRPQLWTRMGVNSGPIVVGNMGSEQRMDYTIMGDTVNLAARLEGANKFYKNFSMISGNTYDRAAEFIDARELDIMRVVGKKEPVTVYDLMDRKNTVSGVMSGVVEEYMKGLALYKQKNFQDAIPAFEKALALKEDDGPSLTYVKRCGIFLSNPPDDDWDGVFTHTEKG